MTRTDGKHDLRTCLRRATSHEHATLDGGMARFDLADARDYTRFLLVQAGARASVERWVERNAPAALRPPPQTALIAEDLAALGLADPSLPQLSPLDADEPLGVAWALGGSSLGNRAMLAQLRKRTGPAWPAAFLSDPAMAAFWSELRPAIEREAEPRQVEAAIASARAVFACFLEALDAVAAPEPA